MAKFDQRNQQVVNQINADKINVVNFGNIQSKAELIAELRNLLSEVSKANKAGDITENISIDVESHIRKAVVEIEKTEPKKKTIIEHLEGAKKLLDGITSATGLINALLQAVKIAGSLFL
jgi:ABC-type hemin transport system substrate-binding protein